MPQDSTSLKGPRLSDSKSGKRARGSETPSYVYGERQLGCCDSSQQLEQPFLRDGRADHGLRLYQFRLGRHDSRLRFRERHDGLQCGADGVCTYDFNHAVPAGAHGTFAIGMEGRRTETLFPGTVTEMNVQYGGDNKVAYFSVDGHRFSPGARSRKSRIATNVISN